MDSIANLDDQSRRIISVFDRDNAQSLRQDNENLREKLRQFRRIDAKKSQELKAKNDDISAIQKELSNTKQRFYEQKTDRVNEMTELKEKLDQKTDELARIKMSAKKETQINQNFEKQIEINQKELEFLREELHTSRNSVAELQEKVVTQEELQGREDIADKIRRQAEIEKSHGENWRVEIKKIKVLEKELEHFKIENKDLRSQAKDKSVAIEKEKVWKSTVSRLQPKCDALEEENEKLTGELVQAKEKHKHLENHLNEMRMKELQWANDIGTLRSSLAVEQSRLKAKSNRIEELLKELEEKKTDISLSHSAKQGSVDISALRDQIKKLEQINEKQSAAIERYRVLGNHDPKKENVLRFAFNPTEQRGNKKRKIISESESSEHAENVKELEDKLFNERKTKEKVIEVVKARIVAFREAIEIILGYQVSSNDYHTFKFLSTFAHNKEQIIYYQKREENGKVGFEFHGSTLYETPELEGLLEELESDQNIPNFMSKTTLALSAQQTLML